jgi:alpha-beta hydrolase superfamily lysophospholipase
MLPGFHFSKLQHATLVRADQAPQVARGVILHLHGFNDYFFQDHFAKACVEAGYYFYAVDIRNAGRSLTADQVPHFVTNFRQYAEDLAEASQAVRAEHPDLPLVVHAHSTGGLTASLWAHAYRNAEGSAAGPDALVLNSPFFEIPGSFFKRVSAKAASPTLGRWKPLFGLEAGPSIYATHQHIDNGGRWYFDQNLKRTAGLEARMGWLRAARVAQARVDRGLLIHCPVLLAVSAASSHNDPELVDTTDTVLDVRAIAARAEKLGRDVTHLRIDNAVHDLTLSADEPRNKFFDAMFSWLQKSLPVASPPVNQTNSEQRNYE